MIVAPSALASLLPRLGAVRELAVNLLSATR